MKILREIPLVTGGGSETLATRAPYKNVLLSGSGALTGNWTIGSPASPKLGQEFVFHYTASMTQTAAETITIFGWTVPVNLMNKRFKMSAFYDGTAWNRTVALDLSTDGILDGAKIETNTITVTSIPDDSITPDKIENTDADGKMLIGQNAAVWRALALSGDVTIDKDGVVTIADGAVDAAKLASSLGNVQLATAELAQGAIQTLNTAPVEIVANPGADKALLILGAFARINPDGAAFTGANGDLEFMHESSSGALMEVAGNFLTSATTKLGQAARVAYNGTEGVWVVANGLYIKAKSNDLGGGGANAKLKVSVAYVVVDFT